MAVDGKNAAEIVKTGAEARKKWALDGLPPTLAPRKGAMAGVTAEQMLNAAEQWDAETQLALAGMYGAGRGLPKDAAKAAYWLEKAAEQGQAEAQYKLGDWYDTGHGVPKDGAKAAYWLEKAAAQGHAEAQYWLGLMYKFGDGVPKNKAEAAYWFKKAAAQGHAGARLNLDQINKSAK
jgi:TPR repeat protein